MIRDRNIDRCDWNHFYRPLDFSVEESTGTIQAPGTGTAVLSKVGSLMGFLLGADGDLIEMLWPFPLDLDHTRPIYCRVHWGTTSTDADEPVFKVGYGVQTDGAALNETMTLVTLATDVASETDNSYYATEWKELAAPNVMARASSYIVSVEFDTISASADELLFFGLEIIGTATVSGGR